VPIEIPVDISRLLSEQPDRGVAIIGAAFLEYYLERLLLVRMRALSEPQRRRLFDDMGAPLATLSSKIEIAFAMNLFGEVCRSDLMIVKSIRNKFAHEILGGEWSFNHPWVIDKCNALQLFDLKGAQTMPGLDLAQFKSTRGKFILAIYMLFELLAGEVLALPPKLYTPEYMKE
jgi:hypothetical protein